MSFHRSVNGYHSIFKAEQTSWRLKGNRNNGGPEPAARFRWTTQQGSGAPRNKVLVGLATRFWWDSQHVSGEPNNKSSVDHAESLPSGSRK